MPFAVNRGQRIHYSVSGSGPLLVLQHGFLVDSRTWNASGFASALSDGYSVVAVDSLGHGKGDKPDDPALYALEQRAGDIIAVLDDLGCQRAHLLGHSMGAWLAVGVARHHRERLLSLTLAGWDPLRGTLAALPAGTLEPLTYDRMLAWARSTAPELVAWVRPELEPALRACWDAMGDLEGAEAALKGAGVPVLFWSGRDDPYRDAMQAVAQTHGFRFFSTPGDHMGAVLRHGSESAHRVRGFLDSL